MKCLVGEYQFYIKETDPSKVNRIFNNLLEEAEFGVVAFTEDPCREGHFAISVLEESHLLSRTRPKQGVTYVELVSCNIKKCCVFMNNVQQMVVSTTARSWSHQMTTGMIDPIGLKENLGKVIQKAGLMVTKSVEHCFPGDGITLGFALENGDGFLTLHSFPEDGKTYIKTTFLYHSGFTRMAGLLDDYLYLP